MNTKILLLSIALSLGFPCSVSTGATYQKQFIMIENPVAQKALANNRLADTKPIEWTFDFHTYDSFQNSNSPEEDGKSHHFHYERLYKIRRKILWIAMLKILLITIHVSSFIYSLHILF